MSIDNVHTLPNLTDRVHVFRDRAHAGEILAGMLRDFHGSDVLVLGIPAGGIPVVLEIAKRLQLTMDIFPVSKILFPWTTESGFGAVAFDGTQWINESLVKHIDLDNNTIRIATDGAIKKVLSRLKRLRGSKPFPELNNRTVILVDDGIAAGSTVRAGIAALQKAQARKIIIAIPTAHDTSLYEIADLVDDIYCANVRSGYSFAVADAYENWSDVSETELDETLDQIDNVHH